MKTWLLKLGCIGNVKVDVHATTTLTCSLIIFRKKSLSLVVIANPLVRGDSKAPYPLYIALNSLVKEEL